MCACIDEIRIKYGSTCSAWAGNKTWRSLAKVRKRYVLSYVMDTKTQRKTILRILLSVFLHIIVPFMMAVNFKYYFKSHVSGGLFEIKLIDHCQSLSPQLSCFQMRGYDVIHKAYDSYKAGTQKSSCLWSKMALIKTHSLFWCYSLRMQNYIKTVSVYFKFIMLLNACDRPCALYGGRERYRFYIWNTKTYHTRLNAIT